MTTLAELQKLLADLLAKDQVYNVNDRGEMYLRLHILTNSPAAVLEGNISTFSGLLGGTAYLANYILADRSQFSATSYPAYSMVNVAGSNSEAYPFSSGATRYGVRRNSRRAAPRIQDIDLTGSKGISLRTVYLICRKPLQLTIFKQQFLTLMIQMVLMDT